MQKLIRFNTYLWFDTWFWLYVLLELGLPKGKAVSSLFGFNLGVELGQILVVTLAIFTTLRARENKVN